MRIAVLLSLIILLGAGCAPTPAAVPEPQPPVSAPEVPAGHPPAVVMNVGEELYPGVEGSFCYEGLCVDKVAPPELVAESEVPFKDISANTNAYFTVGGEVFEFAVSIMDASGAELDVRIPVSFRNGQYFAPVPNVRGNHYLLAHVRFGSDGGDDVTYAFPINVE